jgi:hypothetical protein
MSTKAEKILALAVNFEKNATDSLVAKAKKKEEKKLDPKAKVRNRGTVCVPAESAKDKKDHFPINNEAQARNALARVNQFSKVPEWYSGSLQSLVSLVAKKVKAKYPSIEVSKDAKKPGAKKSYLEQFDSLISKFGQAPDYGNMSSDQLAGYPKATLDYLMQFSMISPKQYSEALSAKQVFERAKPPAGTPGSPEYNSGATADFELPDTTPKPGLGYSKQVEIAQQQLANMGGYDLGTSGRYGTGVDGQLGPKTREALKKFNPYLTEQQAIADLVKRYNAGPEPVKQEPAQPAPENVAQNTPVKTWGA